MANRHVPLSETVTWHGIIGRVNTPTPDGRFLLLVGDSIPSRDLPLPLTCAYDGDINVVGTITELHLEGDSLVASGIIAVKLVSPFALASGTDAVPIAVGTERSAESPHGWRVASAHLSESAWGDTTIKINE